ncbi:hypothetical protein [Mycobacteroides abscessus]|uniref:hypothetical protein n=1 Tax=Mycobacteroides abscessus TaxID=36809 RepID=UPI0009D208EC|nr:hypothetical protein [Mycobacteroides abscessus]SLI66121.1 Uncharacterised protein [Mycobacteroides abscessus subsp. abscessus]
MGVHIRAGSANDGVKIRGRQRLCEEYVTTEDTGIEMTYRRGVTTGRRDALGKFGDVFALFGACQVLDCFDELGAADLSTTD